MHKRTLARVARSGDNVTEFVVSTDLDARDGNIIDQSTWRLDNYRRNPVVLWSHDYDIPPVGRALDIGVEDNQLVATVEWDTDTDLGATVARQYDRGFLSGVSVGWLPGRVTPRSAFDEDHAWYAEAGSVMHDNELLEFSAVSVPSDPAALASRGLPMPDPRHMSIEEIREWVMAGIAEHVDEAVAHILADHDIDAHLRSPSYADYIRTVVWGAPVEPPSKDWFARLVDGD